MHTYTRGDAPPFRSVARPRPGLGHVPRHARPGPDTFTVAEPVGERLTEPDPRLRWALAGRDRDRAAPHRRLVLRPAADGPRRRRPLSLRALQVRDERLPAHRRRLGHDRDELPPVLAERVEDLAGVVLQDRGDEVLPLLHGSCLPFESAVRAPDAGPHDDGEAALLGDAPGILVDDAVLQPQDLRGDLHGLLGHRRRVGGPAEDVDDVDPHVLRHVEERGVGPLAEHLGLVRVHRHDPVALGLEVLRDLERIPERVRGQADDGDRLRVTQDRAQLGVARPVRGLGHGSSLRRISSRSCTMRPVAPQIVRSSSSYSQPRQRRPSARSSSWTVSTSSRRSTGNVRISSISPSLMVNTGGSTSMPTKGTTRMPLTVVWTGGRAPRTSGDAGSRPISSSASRRAVATRSSSAASARPPGNEISPGCRGRASERSVNTSASSGSSTRRASTAASRSPGSGTGAGAGSRAARRRARGSAGYIARPMVDDSAVKAVLDALDPHEGLTYARPLLAP